MTVRRLMLSGMLLLLAILPSTAEATPPHLHASFSPTRLGSQTTVTLGFDVGSTPSPLAHVELHLPSGLLSAFSELGLATCDSTQLELLGLGGCPQDSLVGRGRATVSIPIGSQDVLEPLDMTFFMAPAVNEQTSILVYAEGTDPVISQFVLKGSMLGDTPPYGEAVDMDIPPVGGLPESRPAITSLETELGPKNLRYTKTVNGKTVSFIPEGFAVPPKCPSGGFPFAASFTYANGTHASATTRVPCPRRRLPKH